MPKQSSKCATQRGNGEMSNCLNNRMPDWSNEEIKDPSKDRTI